ncbi:hypothetical protein [Spiroplasma endosymbiont of Labia minor]|uniref:hypothetical protein n=1 Tax=Spiroplasma endosymbiont of Labia minor TaxID=3066305 RepID=UPI0030CF52CF
MKKKSKSQKLRKKKKKLNSLINNENNLIKKYTIDSLDELFNIIISKIKEYDVLAKMPEIANNLYDNLMEMLNEDEMIYDDFIKSEIWNSKNAVGIPNPEKNSRQEIDQYIKVNNANINSEKSKAKKITDVFSKEIIEFDDISKLFVTNYLYYGDIFYLDDELTMNNFEKEFLIKNDIYKELDLIKKYVEWAKITNN